MGSIRSYIMDRSRSCFCATNDNKGLKRGVWTPSEDKILSDCIKIHGFSQWKSIANKTGKYIFIIIFTVLVCASKMGSDPQILHIVGVCMKIRERLSCDAKFKYILSSRNCFCRPKMMCQEL